MPPVMQIGNTYSIMCFATSDFFCHSLVEALTCLSPAEEDLLSLCSSPTMFEEDHLSVKAMRAQ